MKFSDACILATLEAPRTLAEVRRQWPELPVAACLRRLRHAGQVIGGWEEQRSLFCAPRRIWKRAPRARVRTLAQIERAIRSNFSNLRKPRS
jgi:hypothetical protein